MQVTTINVTFCSLTDRQRGGGTGTGPGGMPFFLVYSATTTRSIRKI